MTIARIGELVEYNGLLDRVPYLLDYEKWFMEKYLTIGKRYKVLDINRTYYEYFEDEIISYDILCDNDFRFFIPTECFDFINIKERYGLK